MITTIPTPNRTHALRSPASNANLNPWQSWSVAAPEEVEVLSVAELAECLCPDMCDRDHANE